MKSLSTFLRTSLSIIATALLAACASSGPEIRRDVNPAADFPGYRTFAFFSPLGTDRGGYETLFTSRLKAATRRAMESKGYVYSETHPDLLLNFYANVREKQELRSTPAPAGFYGYRRGYYGGFGWSSIETVTYREGTLALDLVETKRKMLVWQAVAEGTISDEARRHPGAAIDNVVTQMMEPLPALGRR